MKGSITSMAALAAAMAMAGAAHAQTSAEPASAAVSPSVAPVAGAQAPSAYAWGGAWFSNHYAGGYGGAMKALNADNSLWDDGAVVRVDVSGGRYTYNAVGFSDEDVGIVDATVMVGYRKNTDNGSFSAYVGPAYIEHDNDDPAASIRGSEFGAAVLAEYVNRPSQNVELYLQGRFSSPFSTYGGAARALYRVSEGVWLGPQVTLYGNDATYQEITVGPFAKVNTTFGEIGVTGGYRHPTKSGNKDGYFASVYFALPLR